MSDSEHRDPWWSIPAAVLIFLLVFIAMPTGLILLGFATQSWVPFVASIAYVFVLSMAMK